MRSALSFPRVTPGPPPTVLCHTAGPLQNLTKSAPPTPPELSELVNHCGKAGGKKRA
jgi:hypothetical protein